MTVENWDTAKEYLSRSRFVGHNDDYLEFLVRNVWRLDRPLRIADFGCGLGYMGIKLLPLLPEGSSYTGIDKSAVLLKEAESIFNGTPWQYRFIQSEAYSVPFEDNSFDIALSHAVLMHLERATEALNEMIRVTRDGGMIITCDASRNGHNALFYTEGIDVETIPHMLGIQLNRDIRAKTGIDYNIGMKTPMLMDKAGLRNIGCRISDRVTLLFPGMEPDERRNIHEVLCMEGLALPEDVEGWKREVNGRLAGHGVCQADIDAQIANEVALDFRHRGQEYHTVYPGLMTWSYGTVMKVP